jgi:hypothetical protein
MIPDVNEGSPGQFGDLFEGISLEEVKLDRLPLLGREPGIESRRQLLAKNAFDGQLVKLRLSPVVGQTESRVIQFLGRIEMARGKVPAPVEGTVVSNLEDPGTRRAAGNIEQGGFAEDKEKNLLHQIVSFRFVSQDTVSYIADGTRMATKENAESLFGALLNLFQKQFVRDFRNLNDGRGRSRRYVDLDLGFIEGFGGNLRRRKA